MFLSEFKIAKSFKLENFLSKIIETNYNKETLKKTEHSIKEMARLRQNIENINANLIKEGSSIEKQNSIFLEAKKNLIDYSNYVNKLIKKLLLLNSYEAKNVLQEFLGLFQYFDILSGSEFSDDIYYELLFSLYNLSVVYFNLGVNLKYQMFGMQKYTEDLIKEALKDFQLAAAGLTLLKSKIRDFKKEKLINFALNDFNDVVLNFKIALCRAEAQTMIFHLALAKSLDIELQISLAKGCHDCFNALEGYTKVEPLTMQDQKDNSIIINYYANIYGAIWYQKYAEKIFTEFHKTGLNYGYGCTFLKGAFSLLNNNVNYCVSSVYYNLTKIFINF